MKEQLFRIVEGLNSYGEEVKEPQLDFMDDNEVRVWTAESTYVEINTEFMKRLIEGWLENETPEEGDDPKDFPENFWNWLTDLVDTRRQERHLDLLKFLVEDELKDEEPEQAVKEREILQTFIQFCKDEKKYYATFENLTDVYTPYHKNVVKDLEERK